MGFSVVVLVSLCVLLCSSNAQEPSLLCQAAIQAWGNDLKALNETAVIMFDASAKSVLGSDLGSRDDCSLAASRAHYCLAHVSQGAILDVYEGLCVPLECSEQDIVQGWGLLANYLSIPLAQDANITVSCSMTEYKFDGGRVVMFVIIGLLFLFAFVGTALDLLLPSKTDRVAFSSITSLLENRAEMSSDPRDKFAVKFLTSWSVYSNYPRLFAEFSGKTKFLNGIRVLSMFYIILGHTNDYYVSHSEPQISNLYWLLLQEMPKFSFQLILGGFFAVDAFFYLSALLSSYYTVELLAKKGNSAKFWFMYFFHRIWRLLPTYMFVLFFWYRITGIFGYGPLFYFESSREPDPNCEKYWWTNLLFISNLVPWDNNFASECMIWSWYISVDMQLFIISAPIFALWVKNPKLAIGAMLVLIFGGTISVIALTVQYKLTYFGSSFATWDILYTKPWLRFAPYFIGVGAGIFFALSDREPPRKLWLRIFIYLVAATLVVLPICGTYTYFKNETGWSVAQNTIYLAFSRPSFVIGLTVLSWYMLHGYLNPILAFLSADVWGPLSRLTFSAYLLHPVVMYIMFINTEYVEAWTPLTVACFYTAFVFFSYVAALVVWLLVEKPFMNLEKFWAPPRPPKKEKTDDDIEKSKNGNSIQG